MSERSPEQQIRENELLEGVIREFAAYYGCTPDEARPRVLAALGEAPADAGAGEEEA